MFIFYRKYFEKTYIIHFFLVVVFLKESRKNAMSKEIHVSDTEAQFVGKEKRPYDLSETR